MSTRLHQYEKFMRESNAIEGEIEPWMPVAPLGKYLNGRLNKNDLEAIELIMDAKEINEALLLKCHGLLAQGRDLLYKGEYRRCYVSIGNKNLPYHKLNEQMATFWKKWPKMDSWTAHNMYEGIHPFEDLNGRTGRLLWLWKAVNEGYKMQIPFLQAYYYQTLTHHG